MSVSAVDRQFGRLAQDWRERKGWTRAYVAERVRRLGVDWNEHDVAEVETGKHAVSLADAVAVASVTGVPLMFLDAPTPSTCPVCNDRPPPGFRCSTCGLEANADPASDEPVRHQPTQEDGR